MTSHKGPPAPLVGPNHTAPSYGTAAPLSKLPAQEHHSAPVHDVSEPAQKRQKLDDISQRTQSKPPRSNLSTNNNAQNPTLINPEDSLMPKDATLVASKQPSLFPTHPSSSLKSRKQQQGTILAIERAAMRHTVQTKAYVAEPPASTPRYHKPGASSLNSSANKAIGSSPNTEPADFFPWTGHHPEDALNEHTTRNGFYDKLPASQNESLTAKPSILSSLKNKSGLQILSCVFTSALHQRQIHGKITAACTFKPPPRVTLTDTKKETWLRDLANPAIPLRRLSRTIPHGIRGKILLDHCLGKDIPISRAIWLVKCVGANEIRACKRKGTSGVLAVGGETKWIQDWTIAVEQFFETIINSCGSEHWKARLNYGLRLISHIYSEGLLDHNQYLGWIVDHLSTSDLDSLPLWLLIMNIHKQDLLRCRQHGRHLVEALLAQLNHAQSPVNQGVYDIILQELVNECKTLMASHWECFLIPQSWRAFQENIRDYVVRDDVLLESRFAELSHRNKRLENQAAARSAKANPSIEKSIVAAMDSLARNPNYSRVAGFCLKFSKSTEMLVETCIQWASTTYRHGNFRIYAAARLLRIWSRHIDDLQVFVLNFLANSHDVPNIDQTQLYRLCAELVSSKHLSVGKYLQWLMASGALYRYRETSSVKRGDVQLLHEIPLHDLPEHVLNLRRSMLSSLGVTMELEDHVINKKKLQLARQLPSLLSADFPADAMDIEDKPLCLLSRTVKSEIAWWIRSSIAPHQRESTHQAQNSTQEAASSMTRQDFSKLRHIFEELQEYGLFAEILPVLVKATTDRPLLAAITDTINYHFEVFYALAVVSGLFCTLFNKRKLPKSQEGTDLAFISGLADLASRLPTTGPELRQLRKEAMSLDPKQTAAAPSPISDNMVEAVHSDTPTFFEEMDQILANGTSMDQPTLTRCFRAITGHLEMLWDEAIAFPSRYPELLARLRAFDKRSFDVLMTSWLDTLVCQKPRPHLSHILVPMICHKVCLLSTVVDRALKLSQDLSKDQNALVSLELLEMLSSVQSQYMPFGEYRSYRFLHQQQSILQTHAESFVPLIRNCILGARASNSPLQTQSEKLLSDEKVKSFITMTISQISVDDKPSLSEDQDFRSSLVEILSQEEHLESSTSDLSEQFSRLLDNVSNFNRPLTQMRLGVVVESLLTAEQSTSDMLSDVLMEKLENAPQSRLSLWSHLASSLPTASRMSIHENVKAAVLDKIKNGRIALSADSKPVTDPLMEIVVATSFGIPDASALSFLEQISEHLHRLVSSLSPESSTKDSPPESKSDSLAAAIDILLRLLTVYQATLLHPKFSQHTLSRILLSLASLYTHLITAPSSSSYPKALKIHVSDVLALASDALSPDTRTRCIEALSTTNPPGGRPTQQQQQQQKEDPHIAFIFNDANAFFARGVDWLHLISSPHPPPITSATTTATVSKPTASQPYPLRRWEIVQDATPVVTENDTSLSLRLFGAGRAVL